MTGNSERLEACKKAAHAALSSHASTPFDTMEANIAVGLIAVWQGDHTAAEAQHAALKPLRALIAAEEYGFLSIDRLLGLLSHTMSNLDVSQAHFEDGLAFCRKAGYRPELAWTCCDYADTLLERNEPGDRAKAMTLLDESLTISSELGMRPLMERVLSRREILGA